MALHPNGSHEPAVSTPDAPLLLDFYLAIITGKVPVGLRPHFASVTMIALCKFPAGTEAPGLEKPRPHGIGNSDRRMATSLPFFLRRAQSAEYFKAHEQFSIGVPGGCELAAQSLRVLFQDHPSHADAELDGDVMFQRIKRS